MTDSRVVLALALDASINGPRNWLAWLALYQYFLPTLASPLKA